MVLEAEEALLSAVPANTRPPLALRRLALTLQHTLQHLAFNRVPAMNQAPRQRKEHTCRKTKQVWYVLTPAQSTASGSCSHLHTCRKTKECQHTTKKGADVSQDKRVASHVSQDKMTCHQTSCNTTTMPLSCPATHTLNHAAVHRACKRAAEEG